MTNYKNTPEGIAVSQKYADILPLSRPEPSHKHPRMSISSRAKIFSPFAALRGYEEEIEAEGQEHLKVAKIELSEEKKDKLSHKLLQIRKGMVVTVCYFEAGRPTGIPNPAQEMDGSYKTITGRVNRIDPVYQKLQLFTGDKSSLEKEPPLTIAFDNIVELSGKEIEDFSPFFEKSDDIRSNQSS